MNNKQKKLLFRKRMWALAACIGLAIYLGSFTVDRIRKISTNLQVDKAGDTIKYCKIANGDTVPFISRVPQDIGGRYIPVLSSQVDINTFAWWEFVALNWCMDDHGGFGTPYDTLHPVQWETYITKEQLFPPGGKAPPSWDALTHARQQIQLSGKQVITTTKLLTSGSKFSAEFRSRFDSTILDTNDASEAAPENGPNWLGAQNSTNVWYEIRLNRDIYNFVVNNKFYNAANQIAYTNTQRMSMPYGILNTDTVGALELKAAWMEVNDITNPKWARYKLSKAIVQDLNTGKYRQTLLALAGLHILHKTASQQSWIWATFEQIDNLPDTTYGIRKSYNFWNPLDTSIPNQSPSYYLLAGGKGPTPIQVARRNPLPQQSTFVNKIIQASIAENFKGSVWQYYQLVDVIWAGNASQQTSKYAPLNMGYLNNSGFRIVANTTLETYAQTLNCYSCHAYATIAGSDTIASDFSFSLGAATTPALLKQRLARLAKIKNR